MTMTLSVAEESVFLYRHGFVPKSVRITVVCFTKLSFPIEHEIADSTSRLPVESSLW